MSHQQNSEMGAVTTLHCAGLAPALSLGIFHFPFPISHLSFSIFCLERYCSERAPEMTNYKINKAWKMKNDKWKMTNGK
jgi:hypothetical protein